MQPLRRKLDYQRYKDNDPFYNRRRSLKSRYGLSLEVYDLMIATQEGRCLICRDIANLVVDHDHKTKAIRGLLCNLCNTSLGGFRESIELLQRAIQYLMVVEAKQVAAQGCDPC